MLKLDCGVGGGQIIRTALALSTVTGKPFEAFNIRKSRPSPGLKAQHLHCVRSLQDLCKAKVGDVFLGSDKLTFVPGKISSRHVKVDIGTAGSISLLLQSLLLPCLFSDKKIKLEIVGGTDGKWALPFDFFKHVFVPQIRFFAEKIDVLLLKRGYYPGGGGVVEIKIKPLKEKIFPSIVKTEQFNLIQVKGISHASSQLQSASVADRQAKFAKFKLSLGCPVNIQSFYSDSLSPGSGIVLWAIFSKDLGEIDFKNMIVLGSDSLGEKGKKSEVVGTEAAEKLLKEIGSGAPVDSHSADNLIPFMALSPPSRIVVSEVSDHCKSNIWVTEQFLPVKFSIKDNVIDCRKI